MLLELLKESDKLIKEKGKQTTAEEWAYRETLYSKAFEIIKIKMLERRIQYSIFAFSIGDKRKTVFIFDQKKQCDEFVTVNSNYGKNFLVTDFKGFKEKIGDNWKKIQNYSVDFLDDFVIYKE